MSGHRSTRRIPVIAAATILWMACALVALGHDGIPDVQLAPTTVAAGDGLTVAGDDFVDGETLAMVLVGNAARVDVGSVSVGRNGHFQADVRVPIGTADGKYVIEADRPSGPVASAALTVGAAAKDAASIELIAVIVVAVVAGVGGGVFVARRGRPAASP